MGRHSFETRYDERISVALSLAFISEWRNKGTNVMRNWKEA